MKVNTRLVVTAIGLVGVLALTTFLVLNIYRSSHQDSREKITYRLKWLANVGFIGDLYADTYGYFLQRALDVKVLPGGPEHDAIREIETGRADFGVASADQVILARAKQKSTEDRRVIVIAQIYKDNPVKWIYRSKGMKIVQPSDLRGKTVGITFGDNDETIMRALLSKYSINPKDLGLVGVQYSFIPFTKGDVQLFPVYRNTQGVDLEKQLSDAGEQAAFFDPAKWGIHFVANSVVTSERMFKTKRRVVKRFLKAVLTAWEDSLDPSNEERAVRVINRLPESPPNNIIVKQLAQTRRLVLPRSGSASQNKTVGIIDLDDWESTYKIMLDQKIIKTNLRVRDFLALSLVQELNSGL